SASPNRSSRILSGPSPGRAPGSGEPLPPAPATTLDTPLPAPRGTRRGGVASQKRLRIGRRAWQEAPMGLRSFACFLLLCGCAKTGGRVPALGLDEDVVAVQRLHPAVLARACGSSVLGIGTRDSGSELERALRQIAAGNDDGNILVD